MLPGQAAGLVSPAGAEVCGTRHLNVDKAAGYSAIHIHCGQVVSP